MAPTPISLNRTAAINNNNNTNRIDDFKEKKNNGNDQQQDHNGIGGVIDESSLAKQWPVNFLQCVTDKVYENGLIPDLFNEANNADEQGRQVKNEKIVEFLLPDELEKALGDLTIQSHELSEDDIQGWVDKVIRYSTKTCSKYFFNQLYHGVDVYGLGGSWLSDALNTSNYTFEVAPVFTLVEQTIVKYTLRKFGLNEGDGLTSPGGSISNMYAMMLARHKLFPEFKTKGLLAFNRDGMVRQIVVFTSEEGHYSIKKGVNWLGIGTDNLICIPSNEHGQMIPELLEREIIVCKSKGDVPFFVNATAGTTVLGAFDPLDEIADVCRRHSLWLHVDACWGGSVIMSKKYAHLLRGTEKADSLAWNPHKFLGAPLQMALFVTRHAELLSECNSANATYLFQQDKFYDMSYDSGDKSVQCGRKVDAFKFWLMLKSRGEDYFENLINKSFENAEHFKNLIVSHPRFHMIFEDNTHNCTNVCFYYLPKLLENHEEVVKLKTNSMADINDKDFIEEVGKVAPKMKEMMFKGDARIMLGYQPLVHKGMVNFFRMVFRAIPPLNPEDVAQIIDLIDEIGENI